MKNFALAIMLPIMLNACTYPLMGSLTSNGITGAATGKYHKSLGHSALDLLVHKETGLTTSEHLFKKIKNQEEPSGSF